MNRTTKQWVWTEKAEEINHNAKDGEPVWEDFQQCVPVRWVENGYVREAE